MRRTRINQEGETAVSAVPMSGVKDTISNKVIVTVVQQYLTKACISYITSVLKVYSY